MGLLRYSSKFDVHRNSVFNGPHVRSFPLLTLHQHMTKVVRFHELGGPDVLRVEEVELPEPAAGEVLVAMRAIGLNRSEANFRWDRYLDRVAKLPSGLGYEGSGQVLAVGPGVVEFSVGDEVSILPVFLQSRYPVYGEQAIVPSSALVPRPASVDAVTAAAAWMALLTAYGALVDIADIQSGDHVIITAASSSVGLAAMQIALREGAIPIATTNTPDKADVLRTEGAAAALVTGEDNLIKQVGNLTGGHGARVAFDAVAGPAIEELAATISPGGMIIVHGGLSGRPTPLPGLREMRPVWARPYTLFEFTADPARLKRAVDYILSGLSDGSFAPRIDRTFQLDDVVEAHRYLDSGKQIGKIVLTVDADRPEGTTNG